MLLPPAVEKFTVDDLHELSELVSESWASAADGDWSAQAGTVEWSCIRTAAHAVDCVYAPAFFLASRRTDAYPEMGLDLSIGSDATPAWIIESLGTATRLLAAVVNDAPPDTEAVIFRRPTILTGKPADFLPRGAMELILHAHDICLGLGVDFEPPAELCHRLREHTFSWPMWTVGWKPGIHRTDDPWGDLLNGSGRER